MERLRSVPKGTMVRKWCSLAADLSWPKVMPTLGRSTCMTGPQELGMGTNDNL